MDELDEMGALKEELEAAKAEILRLKGKRTKITTNQLPKVKFGREGDFQRQILTTSGPAKKQQLLQVKDLKMKSKKEEKAALLEKLGKRRKA